MVSQSSARTVSTSCLSAHRDAETEKQLRAEHNTSPEKPGISLQIQSGFGTAGTSKVPVPNMPKVAKDETMRRSDLPEMLASVRLSQRCRGCLHLQPGKTRPQATYIDMAVLPRRREELFPACSLVEGASLLLF